VDVAELSLFPSHGGGAQSHVVDLLLILSYGSDILSDVVGLVADPK
jgi:hypothetical protein